MTPSVKEGYPSVNIQKLENTVLSVNATTRPAPYFIAAAWRRYPDSESGDAIDSLKKFLPKLLRMAELEESVRRLSIEIEKTRRRVNALEHTFIPRMIETIKYIMSKLDEMERSNTSRLMKIKAQRIAQEEASGSVG